MSNDECLFCKIVAGEIPTVEIYEDQAILAFLDIGPISDGHTLVIPKQHYEKLHECPPEVLSKLASKLGTIAGAVASAMGCDGYNILCNNGRAAGQLVGHVHFHIIGRRFQDGLMKNWPAFKYPKGKMEEIANKIRNNL